MDRKNSFSETDLTKICPTSSRRLLDSKRKNSHPSMNKTFLVNGTNNNYLNSNNKKSTMSKDIQNLNPLAFLEAKGIKPHSLSGKTSSTSGNNQLSHKSKNNPNRIGCYNGTKKEISISFDENSALDSIGSNNNPVSILHLILIPSLQ